MRHRALFLAVAVGLTAALLLPSTALGNPLTPPRDQWYAQNDVSHWGNTDRVRIDESCAGLSQAEAAACSLEVFKDQPFTVIAFVDTGINPYHQDFRAPEFTHHPAEFIEGYPGASTAVPLSFDVADAEGYDAARLADEDTLYELQRDQLYWFPGTRIIGGLSVAAGGTGAGRQDFPVIDESSHGTGVASVAAGQWYGSNPNALIVMIEGLGMNGVRWAAQQPWIDVISNSWGPGLPGRAEPPADMSATRDATRRGQSVMFSAGNGLRNTNSSTVPWGSSDPCDCKIPGHNSTFTSNGSGPSWHLTIGAASPVNGQAHWWHGIPPDAMSFGSKWRAADAFGVTREHNRDFGGTSCATPVTAGVLSSVILKAREVLGDNVAGQRPDGVVAQAVDGVIPPAEGPLADGDLTRAEAETLAIKSAEPVAFDPETFGWDYAVDPTTPAYFVQQGYGLVDAASKARAMAALLGETPLRDRADVDAWMAQVDAVSDAVWGAP